jgi:hypothetical protein
MARRRARLKRIVLVSATVTGLLAGLVAGAEATAVPTPGTQLSHFAGTGSAALPTAGTVGGAIQYPVGIAADGLGNVFFVSSYSSSVTIWKVDSAGNQTLFAGGGSGMAEGPALSVAFTNVPQIAADAVGNVYLSDTGHYRVSKITPGGTLSYVAGNGTNGAPAAGVATSSPITPAAVTVDPSGTVYIIDAVHYRAVKVTTGGVLSLFAGTGSFGVVVPGPALSSSFKATANGIAADSLGNVYISDRSNGVVEKVNSSGTLSIFAGTGSSGSIVAGPATSSPLRYPRQLAVDAEDSLYIADYSNDTVAKVTTTGTLSILAGTNTSGSATPGLATSSMLNGAMAVAVDVFGNLYVSQYGIFRIEKIAGVSPTTVPSAPVMQSAVPGNGKVSLQFEAPASTGGAAITGYEYSSNGGSTWSALATSESVIGTVTGLANGTSYTFAVRAVNSVGPSVASATVSATPVSPPSPIAPAAPSGLSAVAGNGGVTVSFDVPWNDGGTPISGYESSLDAGASWQALVTSGTDRLTGSLSGLTNGTTYAISVRALNEVGPSAASLSISVTPRTVASAPALVRATAGDRSFTLSFVAPADTGGSPITGYQVSTDVGLTWQALPTQEGPAGLSALVSTRSDGTPLVNGHRCPVVVRALTAVGSGTVSASIDAVPADVPTAVRSLRAAAGNRSAQLTFAQPSSNGGTRVTNYQVSLDGGESWRGLSVQGTTVLKGRIASLVNGRRYLIAVRAVNKIGPGPDGRSVAVRPRRVADR